MHALRKYLRLITLAESSEAGRRLALRVVTEAATRATADVDQTLLDKRPVELLHELMHSDNWIDGSPWMDAFEYHLARSSLPGLEHHVGWN
jgi:hypothetical protein